jgi:hypothetical protein
MSRLSKWLQTRARASAALRGRDSRGRLRAFFERGLGEAGTVYVFGDSQTGVYEALPNAVVRTAYGGTMYGIGRDRAPLVHRLRGRMGRKATLMFVFGGVDARRHIGAIAEKTGRPLGAIIDDLVDAYLRAIDARRGRRPVLIVGVLPPAANESLRPKLPTWGEQAERIEIARRLNARLEAGCAGFGFGFVSHFDTYADEAGRQLPGTTYDGVHLVEGVRAPALAAVRAALASLAERQVR